MSETSFRIEGAAALEDAKRKLAEARAGLQDQFPVMRQLSVMLDQWVQRNFKGEGTNVGGWARYKYGGRLTTKAKGNAQSIEGRRYVDGSARMLQDTGHLRISFLPGVRQGEAYIGSDLPYSAYHEFGTKHLPVRRMLPREDDVKPQAQEIFERWMVVQLRRAAQ